MISVSDNYLSEEQFKSLTSIHLEYNKVHWVGKKSNPENALHELIQSINEEGIGATAWYNIRPINPKLHNDISSYTTYMGKSYKPSKLPKRTYLYYIHAPKTGGQLIIPDIDEEIKPISNRLVSFPIQYDHKIESYTGNRVSIGIIFWPEIPSIYNNANENNILTFNRLWEEEDKRNTI